jgi:hypothetical protein
MEEMGGPRRFATVSSSMIALPIRKRAWFLSEGWSGRIIARGSTMFVTCNGLPSLVRTRSF